MYTIVMDKNKCLSKKNMTTLFQGEQLVDKIRFLIPMKYRDLDLSKFTVTLKYINQGNIVRNEKLELSDETYADSMLCYYLPVDSKITMIAGDVTMLLTFDNGGKHIMYSSETTINIVPQKHFFRYATDDSSDNNQSDDDGFEVVEF